MRPTPPATPPSLLGLTLLPLGLGRYVLAQVLVVVVVLMMDD